MSSRSPEPEVQPQPARAGYDSAQSAVCRACREPLPPGRKAACSPKCRAALSRRRKGEAGAARDQRICRLLEAALAELKAPSENA